MKPRCIVAGITNKVAKKSSMTPRRCRNRPTPNLVRVSTTDAAPASLAMPETMISTAGIQTAACATRPEFLLYPPLTLPSSHGQAHYFGVCSKGSLAYRAFSTSITSTTLPSGLRNGKGFPVYLSEIGSMYLKLPSGRRSTTRPRIWAS
jgi:hypothetical protein